MNKKFMSLPVIGIVVAMLGASVFAASPSAGLLTGATAADGTDLLTETPTHGRIVIVDGQDDQGVAGKKGTDLISAETITSTINNSKWSAGDFTVVKTFDAHYEEGGVEMALPAAYAPVTLKISYTATDADAVIVLHFEGGAWKVVGSSVGKAVSEETFTVNSLSPFAIIKASATTSAQTGEYAGAYIIMVAVALTACGAVFAVRAKKASK